MRHSVIAMLCLVFITTTASSQLTMVPSVGIENAKTMVRVNDYPFLTPLSLLLRPQAGIRLDYKFKSGHGIFAGLSTSNTGVQFSFTNPETSWAKYSAERNATQIRLEAGYQFNSKPFVFKNNAGAKKSCCSRTCSKTENNNNNMKPGCGMSLHHSSCGQSSHSAKTKQQAEKRSLLSVRFQPQLGMAWIPSVKNNFETSIKAGQPIYTYNAGNWNTAFVSGMGFQFARGRNKVFQVNIQYLEGLGNTGNTTLSTNAGTKSTETNFASRVSAWKLSFGIPVSFAKNNRHCGAARKQQPKRQCEQARYRCGTRI